MLRPDGALLIACPFYFHLHAHPHDYWRFTPEALEFLLAPYPSKILGWHGPAARPANVWGLAFREGRPAIEADEFRLYQTRSTTTPACRCRGGVTCATSWVDCCAAAAISLPTWNANGYAINASIEPLA